MAMTTFATHRGTRPGSPIADAIFHYIMFDFSIALQEYLTRMGPCTVHPRSLADGVRHGYME